MIYDCNLSKKTKFYQASTSELFGEIQKKMNLKKQNFIQKVLMQPLKCLLDNKNYRESYGIFASNGILFNHESPRRGETFVTRKITIGISKLIYGYEKCINLGTFIL